MKSVVFNVPDMSCAHCAETIQRAVSDLSGVQNVQANLEAKTAEVFYEENLVACE